MAANYFLQTTIAIVWDFDNTLIPGYMQEPLFRRYGVEGRAEDGKSGFWDEVNALQSHYLARGLGHCSQDVLYLQHILTYVREGRFPDLTNAMLRELGAEIQFYPGVLELMEALTRRPTEVIVEGATTEATVEHYVVSTGLREMILGSGVAPLVRDVWACEFVDVVAPPGFLSTRTADPPPGPIMQVGYSIDNTTKTRAIFEINKGVNVNPQIDVNSPMKPEHRRVPFQNIIYVADGPSDVPVFSVVGLWKGRTFAVYKPGDPKHFTQAKLLQDEGRVHGYGPADYQAGTQTAMWLTATVDEMIVRITQERAAALAGLIGHVPSHL
ncbi:MAG: haloacid dehalogenase-like hydrolase [Chloroflexota bacterium]|nr:haloacid dehalogenase-like hydrolase [Chloroflexota bacterium]